MASRLILSGPLKRDRSRQIASFRSVIRLNHLIANGCRLGRHRSERSPKQVK